MGGNAFENAERMTAAEYWIICLDITDNIFASLDDYYCDIPMSVREKESHGDIDILIEGDGVEALRKEIEAVYNVVGVISNPSGYNLLVEIGGKKVQVDLNKVKWGEFEFAYNYFSWNDLGNLIGRIAHRQGLKFGHNGLWYVYRNGDRVLGEILLSKDYLKALDYLGFDVATYNNGFNTFEQMFEWVKNSKYFEPCAFPLEHRNHQARMRDAKRKTYQAFLRYINFDGEWYASDKAKWLEKHIKAFPVLGEEISRMDEVLRLNNEYKSKVNGHIVSALTGLEGKELGALMSIVKRVLPQEIVLKHSPSAIESGILFAYEIYKDSLSVGEPR